MSHISKKTILVTGGAGYVGSHTILLLLNQDYEVVVIDSCLKMPMTTTTDNNGNIHELPESLLRVERLAGKSLKAFYKLNLVEIERKDFIAIFNDQNVDAVIHFAALKSVSESISSPLEYYTNNLIGTLNLLETMKSYGCKNLIFSSSATVYGLPQYLPVDEKHQVGLNVLNPYGRTKCMIEQILKDLCHPSQGDPKWNIIALRYFNPVGAHPSGEIGEHVQEMPNNLMPYISQVAVKKREKLFVFGNDFDTVDGTGVRDYIHIMDLASGHTHALDYLLGNKWSESCINYEVLNLGTGKGYSVLEVITSFEQINGVSIPYEIIGRREGDAGEVFADVDLVRHKIGWSAKHSLVDMCRDTYRWQISNPNGYHPSCESKEV